MWHTHIPCLMCVTEADVLAIAYRCQEGWLFSLWHFCKELKSSLVLWLCVFVFKMTITLSLESVSVLSDSAHDSPTMSTSSYKWCWHIKLCLYELRCSMQGEGSVSLHQLWCTVGDPIQLWQRILKQNPVCLTIALPIKFWYPWCTDLCTY